MAGFKISWPSTDMKTVYADFRLHLNPASVEFAEDLPTAGRCKAARAQTYYDTSSPCQHRRFGKIGAP